MHSPRPVSAESTLRGRTARALYHIPAGMCQKTPIRTDREGERTRIRTGGTINTSMPQHRNAKPAPSPAEQVRLPLQWCVYFRALRDFSDFFSRFFTSLSRVVRHDVLVCLVVCHCVGDEDYLDVAVGIPLEPRTYGANRYVCGEISREPVAPCADAREGD